MKKVFETLKGLYNGENIVKKHLIYVSLLILPSIAAAIKDLIDKEMPKNLMIILFIILGIFLLVSIIPALFLQGFALKFYNDRFKDSNANFPMLDKDMFMTGVRVIPLHIVWGIYYFILLAICTAIALLPLFITGFSSPQPLAIGLSVFLGILMLCVFIILIFILSPFTGMIVLKYSKELKYTSDLFNPMLAIKYIQNSFKPIIITALKYLVAGLIAGFASGFVQLLLGLLIIVVTLFAALFSPENAKTEYTPLYLTIVGIIAAAAGVIQSYVSAMVGLGYSASLIEVYKEENLDDVTVGKEL